MNAKLPLVLTSASVAAFMAASANAAPVGNAMDYTQVIVITSASPILNGSGSGVGTGAFDSDGTLFVESAVTTKIGGGLFTGTVYSTTVYQGSISDSTWTYSGTSTASITGCSGSPVVCGNVTPGPGSPTTGNPIFTLDILAGGEWNTESSLAGLINLDTDHTLTPQVVPLPAAAWLFGSALLGLAGVARKRKA